MNDILTSTEAAAYLGMHPRTLYRLMLDGKIPYRKLGGRYHFRKSELDTWWALQPGVSVEESAAMTSATPPIRLPRKRTQQGNRHGD